MGLLQPALSVRLMKKGDDDQMPANARVLELPHGKRAKNIPSASTCKLRRSGHDPHRARRGPHDGSCESS